MIALSGNFPGLTHSAVETDFVNVLGAALTKSVNEDTTHLVTTNFDLTKPSAKVKQAKLHDVHIVSLQWPKDCKEQDLKSSENDYSLAANTATAATTASGSCKRTTNDDAGGNNSQPKSKKTKAAAANGFQMQSQDASQSTSANSTKASSKPAVELKVEREFRDGPTNVVKSSAVNIFIDETCTFTHYTVYIDSDGVIFDTNLNQTNARNNNNKFYRLQVDEDLSIPPYFGSANTFRFSKAVTATSRHGADGVELESVGNPRSLAMVLATMPFVSSRKSSRTRLA